MSKRHVTDCLEPEAENAPDPTTYALWSIAISLRRIADAVTGDENNTGIHAALIGISDRMPGPYSS